MNNYHQIMCKPLLLVFGLLTIGVNGQTQKKEYKESFKVNKDAVVEINTSHADIEFDTWNKNEVVVEATIELEGATEEEAAAYFEENGVKILGNSDRVEVSTAGDRSWSFKTVNGALADLENIVIDIPEIPDLEPLFLELQIPEIPEIVDMPPMPPMPPMKFENFDYEKYKEDGEKYIEEWAKAFEKNFDKEYQQKWQEWGERFAARMEERAARYEERGAEREELLKEREEMVKEREEIRQKAMEERRKAMEERRKLMEEKMEVRKNVVISGDAPRVFYRSGGESKSFKVKKTIKIKMPKSAKLDMNVRHGEVKLAENTKNMQATLSYSRLLASTIDGDQTNILASYSPVNVQKWNYGKLKAQFSEDVAIQDAQHLSLVSTSSEVTIDRLLNSAKLSNNLGRLKINSIDQEFADLDISVQNGELVCVLPDSPFQIYIEGVSSDLSTPAKLNLEKRQEGNRVIHTGYHGDPKVDKEIRINARYSDIALKQ